jgi:hypothetical protein
MRDLAEEEVARGMLGHRAGAGRAEGKASTRSRSPASNLRVRAPIFALMICSGTMPKLSLAVVLPKAGPLIREMTGGQVRS